MAFSERKGSMKVKDDPVFASRRRSDESRQMYRHLGSPTWYQDYPSVQSSTEDVNECNEGVGNFSRHAFNNQHIILTLCGFFLNRAYLFFACFIMDALQCCENN